jgi:hypothetical protein
MPLNILKLCVGADSVEDQHEWIASGRANWPHGKRSKYAAHITRQTPKRAGELGGGSLYWVIRGHLCVRQPLVRLEACVKEGVPHCALVLEKRLILTRSRPCRAFQGWRYLSAEDAPPDLGPYVPGEGQGSESLRRELMELGLD